MRWAHQRAAMLVAGLVLLSVSGCFGGKSDPHDEVKAGPARVGVIMPDDDPAQRWTRYDTPMLKQAFAADNVPVEIANARRNPAEFRRIAHDMIRSGVRVLIITSLDPDSGKAVLDDARAHHVSTIDYDRLTLGGGADYYVSFDNDEVGVQQATSLGQCLTARRAAQPVIAEMNGAPSDNNAAQFKEGADGVLSPLYDTGHYLKGPDQWVPDWDYAQAKEIFAQMLRQRPNISGVLAANDGIAGAVIDVLKAHGMAGRVPVTGQDATAQGLQRVLDGEQCMTVYKPIRPEAKKAASVAGALFTGVKVTSSDQVKDPVSGAWIPFSKLQPTAIDAGSVKNVVADGFLARKDVCTGRYASLCDRYGVK